ncbi:MAG: hypothetical protein H6713_38965 [Myxococcales bacterium]|nr:hypothetical protein [Myxococcales bacterium]
MTPRIEDGDARDAAARLLELTRAGAHDLVVSNPPYQDTSDVTGLRPLERAYPEAGTELYSMFMLRGVELARPGGRVAMVTRRGWLHLRRFARLREALRAVAIERVADLGAGAFADIDGELVQAAMFVLRARADAGAPGSMAAHDVTAAQGVLGKARALRCDAPRWRDPTRFHALEGAPIVLAWSDAFIARYLALPKLGDHHEVRQGLATGDNARFLRRPWELAPASTSLLALRDADDAGDEDAAIDALARADWVPYIKGARGARWFEPVRWVLFWRARGLAMRLRTRDGRPAARLQNQRCYFRAGLALASAGRRFSARRHRVRSVFDVKGHSLLARDGAELDALCCLLNSRRGREVIERLNPSLSFQVSDIQRVPLLEIPGARVIMETLARAFAEHEAGRETSAEFRAPAPSPWRHAQRWAQEAVDRDPGAPLPAYAPELDPPAPAAELSYALGRALGRFAPAGGVAEEHVEVDMSQALPGGLLLIDNTLGPGERGDSLSHPACAPLRAAWARVGAALPGASLRDYLGAPAFREHLRVYDKRPIYWPLCSRRRRFIVWCAVHRADERTLERALREHLDPARARLEGRLAAAAEAERGRLAAAIDELDELRAATRRCASAGPDDDVPRERDAPYRPALEDGVRVNAAPLWPLLLPLWSAPRETWRALASPSQRQDLDWSKTAARYWPARVATRCAGDPSLAAAHGALWRLHPRAAWRHELREQLAGAASVLDEADRQVYKDRFITTRAADVFAELERALLLHLRATGASSAALREPSLIAAFPRRCLALADAIERRLGRAITLTWDDDSPRSGERGPLTVF